MSTKNMRITVLSNAGLVAASKAFSFKNAADITVTAAATGSAGNDIQVEFVAGAALGIAMVDDLITVTFVDAITTSADIAGAAWPAAVGCAGGNDVALVAPDDAQGPINLEGGFDGIVSHECAHYVTDLEVQNTSQNVTYFTLKSNPTTTTGYPLKPMSGAATFDGGVYKTTTYNGMLYFYSAAASQVRIVEVGSR